MAMAEDIRENLGEDWIPNLYKNRVRTQRTRSHQLPIPQSENSAEIRHTLLGIELKVGRVRISCPDLSTARYLQVFARIGCQNVAVPYDITKISSVADEFESSWRMMFLLIKEKSAKTSASARGRLKAKMIRTIRNEINLIGAGEQMPEFKKSTKQRKHR